MSSRLYEVLQHCLLCGSERLRLAVPLEPMPIATPNAKLPAGVSAAEANAGVPLDLFQCDACGHVQVGVVGNPEVQYREYVYTTSLSLGLREHFDRYAGEVIDALALAPGRTVVEVGSNDGTLLEAFGRRGMHVHGVDPARRIATEATARGIPTLGEFFDAAAAATVRAAAGPAAAIVANNVLANVPNLDGFMQGVAALLDGDGVFVFETQYGADVVTGALLDTVYHEHISYFLIAPLQPWLARYGLELIDVWPIATKGGSFRAFAQRIGGARPVAPAVGTWIEREHREGMFAQPFFARLSARLAAIRAQLNAIVDAEEAAGRPVGGFGVSVGTSALLPQFGLTHRIAFLVDDDPNKPAALEGPGYRIPVLRATDLAGRSGVLIVFAWRYVAAIAARHADFVNRGGRLIVPLPEVHEYTRTAAPRG